MNPRTFAILGLMVLTPLTVLAVINDGANGFPNAIVYSWTSLQIWLDLVIAVLLWCAWVVVDARAAGRNPWPWIIAALIVGCFSPLLYTLLYARWPGSAPLPGAVVSGSARLVGMLAFLALLVVTIVAVAVDGIQIADQVTRTTSNLQIWVDLVIAIVFWLGWMWADARARGASPWGWLVFALALGSFAPLVYLMVYDRSPASHPPA